MNIGKAIKTRRKELALTQKNLASKCEIDYKYLSLIELGKSVPSLHLIEIISKHLKIPLFVLFFNASENKDVLETRIKRLEKIKPIIDDLFKSLL